MRMPVDANRRDLRAYLLGVLFASLPFYAIGLTGGRLPFLPALPVSALMAVVPGGVALVLAARVGDAAGLLRRAASLRGVTAGGLAAAVAIMPLVYLVSALGLWLTRSDLPAPLWADPAAIGLSLALFLLAAIAEELGWQAYAWPRMRGPALRSALLLGGIWALWHLVPFVVMGRPASWIVPHLAMAVLMRVVIVWLAVNFGPGLLLAVVLHCLSNAAWGLIDNFDAYYAPGIAMLALLIVVLAVLVRDGPSLRRA